MPFRPFPPPVITKQNSFSSVHHVVPINGKLDAQRSCRGTQPVTRLQKVDLLDATPLLPLSSRQDFLASAAFSPDGNTLALASRERGVQLFRAVPIEKVLAQPSPD
jgi:hypothetical protein